MKQLQPVIWMKGTYLSPQHLQTQDRFLENTLRFQLESLAFQPWGFAELQTNQEALASGDFQITRAAGMFPDGLAFDIRNSDAAPHGVSLADQFDPDQQEIGI
jgi:type VI secretion system protein ImpJ